jgi:branched-chain amino acid transport system permease protein
VFAVICGVVGVTVVYVVLNHTKVGSAIRAVGFERRTAQIVGINPRTMIITAAALSGAITGLAGILLATGATFDSTLGDGLLLQGFAAVVIGGMDDIRGSAIAGLLIGIVQVMSGAYISSSFQDVITFGLVIIVLLWRPMGLFRSGNLQRV